MKTLKKIERLNKEIGYERYAIVKGYKNIIGMLDRSGKVEKTFTFMEFAAI